MSVLAKKVFELFGKPELAAEAEKRQREDRQACSEETRSFLPRPLGQEDATDPWEVWAPFFDWLIENSPDRFHSVCEAEEAIRAFERTGITAGQEYEQACAELLRRFEAARRRKLSQEVKVWLQ